MLDRASNQNDMGGRTYLFSSEPDPFQRCILVQRDSGVLLDNIIRIDRKQGIP